MLEWLLIGLCGTLGWPSYWQEVVAQYFSSGFEPTFLLSRGKLNFLITDIYCWNSLFSSLFNNWMTNLIFLGEGNLSFMLSSPAYEKYKCLFFSFGKWWSECVFCSSMQQARVYAWLHSMHWALGVCWGSASGSMLLAGTVLTFPLAGKVGTSAGVITVVVFRGACSWSACFPRIGHWSQ